jgi:hypothetical protein
MRLDIERWLLSTAAILTLAVAASAGGEDAKAPAPENGLKAAVEEAAQAATPAEPKPIPVTPEARKLWEGEDGAIRMLNRVQIRWRDNDNVGEGGEFRIRRAKTELTGWVLSEHLTYELQLSWAGPEPGASTQTPLEDFILSWDASKDGRYKLTVGQFKVPLGRQEMTSSGKLQFLDRDLLSFEFTRGRDIGIQLEGALYEGKLEYMAGIFNGNPASRLGNDNDKYQYNARVMFQPWGAVKYSESDFESSDKPLLAVAVAFEHNDARRKGSGATPSFDEKSVIFGVDASFKYRGASAFGEFFFREKTPVSGPSYNSPGFHFQAGYFIMKDRLEAALRLAEWDPSEDMVNDRQTEWGVAINYFIRKHGLKLQGDYRELKDDALQEKTKELRVQAQVMF